MPRESAQREIQMPLDEQEVIAIVGQERSSDLASAEAMRTSLSIPGNTERHCARFSSDRVASV